MPQANVTPLAENFGVILSPSRETDCLPLERGEIAERRTSIPSSGHRLLVVDDNKDAADSLAMLLSLQGHEVRVAHSGPAALELARDYRPAIIDQAAMPIRVEKWFADGRMLRERWWPGSVHHIGAARADFRADKKSPERMPFGPPDPVRHRAK